MNCKHSIDPAWCSICLGTERKPLTKTPAPREGAPYLGARRKGFKPTPRPKPRRSHFDQPAPVPLARTAGNGAAVFQKWRKKNGIELLVGSARAEFRIALETHVSRIGRTVAVTSRLIGISAVTMSSWLTGKSAPDRAKATRILATLAKLPSREAVGA